MDWVASVSYECHPEDHFQCVNYCSSNFVAFDAELVALKFSSVLPTSFPYHRVTIHILSMFLSQCDGKCVLFFFLFSLIFCTFLSTMYISFLILSKSDEGVWMMNRWHLWPLRWLALKETVSFLFMELSSYANWHTADNMVVLPLFVTFQRFHHSFYSFSFFPLCLFCFVPFYISSAFHVVTSKMVYFRRCGTNSCQADSSVAILRVWGWVASSSSSFSSMILWLETNTSERPRPHW